ncbi:NKG2-D type II integral membrane protein-like [Poecilia latipinna]|uniref:NKG2-D type II integral membrane protein-like n=1 Tax=Poecilia latipinna TaxID=48699 RepID=UPI00072EDAA2|nr:PREDICTED: NKG2-D type II integral membrane protein-like [Poecilia latipinna]XP_014882954.1 PREDICTED: NKG2-D type II integral membrane protein-like [Poecilia latipinna]
MDPGCKPCLHDWIFFQKKCYLFYDEPAPWKTWEQSRRFCQDRRADLVVIDDLEEQEFVSKHVKSYFDIQWGYWLGLQQTNNTWTWVDGHVDTLGCANRLLGPDTAFETQLILILLILPLLVCVGKVCR